MNNPIEESIQDMDKQSSYKLETDEKVLVVRMNKLLDVPYSYRRSLASHTEAYNDFIKQKPFRRRLFVLNLRAMEKKARRKVNASQRDSDRGVSKG